MATVRHLPNAPITEGLIDIRVRLRTDADTSLLAGLSERLRDSYRTFGPIVHQQVEVQFSPQQPASSHTVSRDLGVRYHSLPDERYVAQFQLSGFTLSRLSPYETWDKLIAETQRLWRIYVECVSPQAVTRVATRFINNLRLPMQTGDRFETYLAASPQVPQALPQSVSAFLQRVVIYSPQLQANANVTQFWQPGNDADRVSVILDIDVYRETEFSPDGVEMWEYLSQLRALKNAVFFESLTEKAVELYL